MVGQPDRAHSPFADSTNEAKAIRDDCRRLQSEAAESSCA